MEIRLYRLYWVIQGKGQSFFLFLFMYFLRNLNSVIFASVINLVLWFLCFSRNLKFIIIIMTIWVLCNIMNTLW